MPSKTEIKRRARLRKAAQRQRLRATGVEEVTFFAPSEIVAKLRAAGRLHKSSTLQAVLVTALTEYANQVEKGTQDLATAASRYWPRIRPLLPYLSRLTKPTDRPIVVQGTTYTYEAVAPLAPVLAEMIRQARQQGHSDYVRYFDLLVGGSR